MKIKNLRSSKWKQQKKHWRLPQWVTTLSTPSKQLISFEVAKATTVPYLHQTVQNNSFWYMVVWISDLTHKTKPKATWVATNLSLFWPSYSFVSALYKSFNYRNQSWNFTKKDVLLDMCFITEDAVDFIIGETFMKLGNCNSSKSASPTAITSTIDWQWRWKSICWEQDGVELFSF